MSEFQDIDHERAARYKRQLAAELIGHRRAIELLVEPVAVDARVLYVRSPDTSAEMRRRLRLMTRHDVNIAFASASDVIEGITSYYGPKGAPGTESEINEIWQETIAQAADLRASNIFLEWGDNQPGRENSGRIRIDVGGRPFVSRYLTLDQYEKLTGLITERAVSGDVINPQIGQRGTLSEKVDGRMISLRYSSFPQDHPEYEGLTKLVLRVLQRHEFLPTLEEVGLDPDQREIITNAMLDPRCVLLIGAPPGEGKTTTMYALIPIFDLAKDSIFTIEDPPETHIPGTTPTRIALSRNWDTEAALTEILRQQPTGVIVGELIERSVAELAMKASKRGVRLGTTIHATDARAIIDALINFDIPMRTVAYGPTMLVSQRLVHRLCDDCKVRDEPNDFLKHELDRLAVDSKNVVIWKTGPGCDACLEAGDLGRRAVFETLALNRNMRKAIMDENDDVFMKNARDAGYVTMLERAIVYVLEGSMDQSELRILPSSEAHELPVSRTAQTYMTRLNNAVKMASRRGANAA